MKSLTYSYVGGEGFGKDLYGMVGGGDISSKEEIPFCIF